MGEGGGGNFGPVPQKLGSWAPIQNFNLMADLAERRIFKKIHVAAQKLPSLGHFGANPPKFFLQMKAKDNV